ncbi:hypothetical protein QJS10_CPA06g00117 [Acorus calamus]|uniref:Wbp11/ELF5/Saf1 N-terminal domain-containing protein n=1 Tax=Acorus calamus TaxID=4465 RepID=A0AAV9ELM0_ACOCL|nr:hypothetical protein QJS10_CPA06g00117 [Acorus calamus]
MKTTKGGKVMNPTDAYRKELRKKELKRNKKERKKVREVGILKKDPESIKEQIDKLEMMRADGALDKARKHKKRQLEDTLKVVMKKRKKVILMKDELCHKNNSSSKNEVLGGSMSDSMVKRESTRHSLKEDVKQIEREILSPLKINNRGLDDLDSVRDAISFLLLRSEHNSKVSGDSCAYLSYSKESMSPCEGIVVNQLKSSMEQLQEEIRLQLEMVWEEDLRPLH